MRKVRRGGSEGEGGGFRRSFSGPSAAFPLVAFFFAASVSLHSQNTLILTDVQERYPVARFMDYLEDPEGSLTIEEVASPEMRARFTRNTEDAMKFETLSSTYWLRLAVENASEHKERWILVLESPSLWSAGLFSPDESGGFSVQQQGNKYPFAGRDIKNRNLVFSLEVPRNTMKAVFLRVTYVPSKIPVDLYTEDAFYHADHDAQFVYGLYYGIMAVMILFNLMLFLFLKDKSYLFLVLFIAAGTVNQMCLNGFANEYLWPRAVLFNQMSQGIMTGLAVFTGILFTLEFLSIKKRFPKLYGMFIAAICLSLAQIVNGVIDPFVEWVSLRWITHNVIVFVIVSLAIFSAIISMVKKYRESRFFLLAWLSYLLGTIVYIIGFYSLIPHNLITENGMQIGSALVVILMSVALADRYRLIRLEKEIAERTNIQRTDFFTNLSHEIKTPLTLISNYMDLYIDRHGPAGELTVVKRNVDKLLSDMMNFFDVLKLERGVDLYDHGLISDLSDILRQKIALFESMARGKDVDVSGDIEEGLYSKADPLAVERIVNNLMENAVRYNKKGGGIRVSLAAAGEKILLTVEDTGIGIEVEQLNNIFQPYFQISHRKRNIQGIGMGLSLVKGIVDSLGGTIDVRSRPGEGTAFTVTMQRYRLREGDSVSHEALLVRPVDPFPRPIEITESRRDSGGFRSVLIVEDNAELLSFLRERLGGRYKVTAAVNGRDALEKLVGMHPPDVIVSDIMMDEMDGYDLFKRVTAMEGFRNVPFIFLTAKSRLDEKIEGLELGAIDYIYKPFVTEELASRIDSILRYRDLEKKIHEKDRFASLGMLLGGISHEIFNPLSGITGPLGNLERLVGGTGMGGSEKAKEYFQDIKDSIAKIEGIINNLRILYSDKSLGRAGINLADAAAPIVEELRARVGSRVLFVVEIEKDVEAMGDPEALRQILRNLLSNAVEAIPDSGTVTITGERSEGETRITVSDTGRGIPREDQERIFEAFYTTKDAGKGIGLGLNIVKNLIFKMGWEIAVDSSPGAGAAFTVIAKEGRE